MKKYFFSTFVLIGLIAEAQNDQAVSLTNNTVQTIASQGANYSCPAHSKIVEDYQNMEWMCCHSRCGKLAPGLALAHQAVVRLNDFECKLPPLLAYKC